MLKPTEVCIKKPALLMYLILNLYTRSRDECLLSLFPEALNTVGWRTGSLTYDKYQSSDIFFHFLMLTKQSFKSFGEEKEERANSRGADTHNMHKRFSFLIWDRKALNALFSMPFAHKI